MAKTTWGRKETFIWPRHMPIYTYGAAFSVLVLTVVFSASVSDSATRH